MQVRSIRPEEIDCCLDLLDKAFEDTPRDYFKKYFDGGDPWFKPEYTRLCDEDGVLVSTVQICNRYLRYGSESLVMGGIANVGTPAEYRGKGYSSEALKSSIEVMSADKMDFSILLTSINAFYERQGWVTVTMHRSHAQLKASLEASALPYTVRPYSDADVETVVDIFNEFNASVVFSTIRTAEYWDGFVNNPQSSTYEVFIAESDGEPVAYVAGNGGKDSFNVAELCCLNGHEDALIPLMREVYDRCGELSVSKIHYMLPDVASINSAISHVSKPLESTPHPFVMLRIINLKSLFEKALPELVKRSSALTGAAKITIAVQDFGAITLDIAPGKVSISDESSDLIVDLIQPAFWDLFFGFRAPMDILTQGPGTEALAALFPKQPSVFYYADNF